jgi:RNA polymerase sigma-70 factor (ECF subfamily)
VEKEKFIAIIKEHQKLIYKVCHSYCYHPENRKDLQQEILLQLWGSMPKFDGRVKLSTWIYRIALNTAITFYRKDSKYNNNQTSLDEAIISVPNNEPDSGNQENLSVLFQFIEQLGEMDKALILLYLDDIKYKDIADILGISETNVATKISRIKKRLKEQFTNL